MLVEGRFTTMPDGVLLPDPFEGMDEEPAKECLRDPMWRLCHLYYILDKWGKTVLFRPNAVQKKFIDDLWYRNVVPKGRQRGFSTVVQLMELDACIFVPNTSAAITAQDEDVAKKIRDKKIKFAWDRLPERIRSANPLIIDNITELKWQNGSTLLVANSTRGDTLQWLHVSEYGIICANAPDKADEIMSGSFPSVAQGGIIVVESTVESNEGHFADMTQRAMETAELGRPLSKMEYRLHFATWWDADEYETDPTYITITPQDHAYFDKLEVEIQRPISLPKRAWYVAMRDNEFGGDQEKMWRQHPSTLAEAFTVSPEGKWLITQMSAARRQGRITKVPYDPSLPVNTFWDLGVQDDIAIWFHQQVGPRNHFIDYFEINNVAYSPVVKALQEKPYIYGQHHLPHDGNQRRPGAEVLKTPADMLEDLGLRGLIIVPRISDIIVGITQLREAFGTYWFDAENCQPGLKHCSNYSKTWNVRQQQWLDIVLENGHQHAVDALRQHAQYRHQVRVSGPVSGRATKVRRPNKSGMAA